MEDKSFSYTVRYWWAFCAVAGVTFGCGFLEPYIGYRTVGFAFLLTVLIIGFYNPLGPVLSAAFLSALSWNIFFIPPRFTLAIGNPEDIALCIGYFIAAAITGVLTSRSRALEALASEREQHSLFLYEVVKDILDLSKPEEFIRRIEWRVEELLGGKCQVVLSPLEKSQAPYTWNLQGRHINFGQLVYSSPIDPTVEQQALLESVAQQIGLSLERLQMETRLRNTEKLEESERLHQTLLNSVSHELRTPLTTLMGFASSLKEPASETPQFRKALAEGLSEASERMNRVVGNLLDMSRLNSGALSLRREWHDINDLIGVSLHNLKNQLRPRSSKVLLPQVIPLIQIDFHLMEQALSNLILNACTYSPPGTPVVIEVEILGSQLCLSVNDEGPGIPEHVLPHLFEKFYRAPGTPPGGTGLGLSIVRSIVELHSGTVEASNRSPNGARFSILLPLGNPPPNPREDSHE